MEHQKCVFCNCITQHKMALKIESKMSAERNMKLDISCIIGATNSAISMAMIYMSV